MRLYKCDSCGRVMENKKHVCGGVYSGHTYIYEQSFNTYDEAFNFAMSQY